MSTQEKEATTQRSFIKKDENAGNRFTGTVSAGGNKMAAQAKALAQSRDTTAEPSSKTGPTAAQSFLKDKMSGNPHGDVTDPNNPYSMGEGKKAMGKGYEDQYTWAEKASDGSEEPAEPAYEGPKLTAEEIREKFGLDYNEEHAKTPGGGEYGVVSGNAIYARPGDADSYIGTLRGDFNNYKNVEDYAVSNGLIGAANTWNTINDVARSAQVIWREDGEEGGPEMEGTPKEIEHSEEIRQAKERVQEYEEGILSGATSEAIFNNNEVAESKYNMDLARGSDGIGSPQSSNSRGATSDKAARSFLSAKVGDTKSQFNFKPR